MNLFSALSEGRGRLTETNLSAFLAFLLTPSRVHGLSDMFLRSFLAAVAQATGERERFTSVLRGKRVNAEVGLEVRHALGSASRTVDIEIELYDADGAGDSAERHRLIIENKIRPGAAQEAQFKDEFQCVLGEVDAGTAITNMPAKHRPSGR